MEAKIEKGGKLSVGSTNRKSSKYKKIMNQITTALHYTKNSSVSKRASEIYLKDPQRRDSVACSIEVEDVTSIPDIHETLNESISDPVYSAIHPFKNIEPKKEENCSPPLPPKNLEDLYAKVKKKKVIDYNRNGLNLQNESSSEANGSCSNQIENTEPKALSFTMTDILSDEVTKDCTEMCGIETKVDELHTWKVFKRQQHKKLSAKSKSIDDKQLLCGFPKDVRNSEEQEQTKKKESHSSKIPFTHQFNVYSKSSHRKRDGIHTSSPIKHNKEDNYKKALQEYQADLWNFQQKLEDIVDENKSLHQHIHTLLDNEAKWNVEMANLIQYRNENSVLREKNSHLMQDLYSVEEKSRKEVKILSDKMHQLQSEKDSLLDKLHSALHEKKDLESNFSEIKRNYSETISIQTHLEKIQVNQRELEVSRMKYKAELDRILESYQTVERERALLSIQVQDLKDEVFKLQQDNQALKDSEQEATKSKNLLFSHLEESKAYSYETQNLIASLLKVAEAITSERDIAVTKSHFQDYQQKKMEDSVVEHTIGIGRLQEHMLNIKKKANEEIRKIGESCTNFEITSVKNYYERQIKFLKENVMQKNEKIMSLDSEKNMLHY